MSRCGPHSRVISIHKDTTFYRFPIGYDGEGNTHDLCYKPNRGDLLIFKSTVLHGSYPVRDNKKVFVVDYFYEDKYV